MLSGRDHARSPHFMDSQYAIWLFAGPGYGNVENHRYHALIIMASLITSVSQRTKNSHSVLKCDTEWGLKSGL